MKNIPDQDFTSPMRLLTIEGVAQITGLSVGTLYHFVSERRIPVVRISKRCIRFELLAIRQWIEALSDAGNSVTDSVGKRRPVAAQFHCIKPVGRTS